MPNDQEPIQRDTESAGMMKAYQSDKDIWTFVASTDAIDRYGDIVVPEGISLRNFKRNPIALWQHSHNQPIGTWEDIRVEGNKLIARLKMVEAGVSSIADMVRKFIQARVLKAVSIGFMPIGKPERILDDQGNWKGGLRFTKSDLLEISVVSVPANQEALAVARSMGISDKDLGAVFEEPSLNEPLARSASTSINTPSRNKTMPTLAERIAAREAANASLRDQITELSCVEDMTSEDSVKLDELTRQLDAGTSALTTLQNAQRSLAASAAPAGAVDAPAPETQRRAAPAVIHARGQKDPAQLFFRASMVQLRAFCERRSVDDIIRSNWGGAKDLEAVVRAVVDPAMTGVTGWAAELVGETVGGFVDVLRPDSIFFRMPMGSFNFGRGKLKLPGRDPSQTLAGDFVAEGAPIPVKKLGFVSTTLEPHKLGVITTFTREIARMSDPQIEPLLRDAMIQDTRETIDTLFLDNVAATPGLRPAGAQQLAGTNTAASAGTTLANIVTDLRAAVSAMTTANMGRNLVWVMNKQRIMSLSLVTNAAGAFMFRDELAQGTLLGLPVLASTTVPADVVFLMDAAELAAAYDGMPAIDVSEQATLHMESTPATVPPTAGTVQPIAYPAGGAPGGTPGTGAIGDYAQPVRSLFQTASVALRLIWDMSWNQRRQGAVYTITGVAW